MVRVKVLVLFRQRSYYKLVPGKHSSYGIAGGKGEYRSKAGKFPKMLPGIVADVQAFAHGFTQGFFQFGDRVRDPLALLLGLPFQGIGRKI